MRERERERDLKVQNQRRRPFRALPYYSEHKDKSMHVKPKLLAYFHHDKEQIMKWLRGKARQDKARQIGPQSQNHPLCLWYALQLHTNPPHSHLPFFLFPFCIKTLSKSLLFNVLFFFNISTLFLFQHPFSFRWERNLFLLDLCSSFWFFFIHDKHPPCLHFSSAIVSLCTFSSFALSSFISLFITCTQIRLLSISVI